jgi:alanine racemase
VSVVLTVEHAAWSAHLASTLTAFDRAVIPVVKGNGYGLGRRALADQSARLGLDPIAVGTVHEVGDLPSRHDTVVVLTPTLDPHLDALPANVALTVGSEAQLRHAADRAPANPLVIKLRSTMHRHGFAPGELPATLHAPGGPLAYALHPPLDGTDDQHLDEVERWLPSLDPAIPLHVSHLGIDAFVHLREAHPDRTFAIRLGTRLWHGDKATMRLRADVLDAHRVEKGTALGYRAVPAPTDGTVVVIGGGSAHGIAPLPDGRSPFHFARTRLALVETPHMHVSMAFVSKAEPCPTTGEWVDVQRPLITTQVDRVDWLE